MFRRGAPTNMSQHLNPAPYRGTRDFLPDEMSVRQQVFGKLYQTIENFGYQRYDGPVLEPVEIYEAKSGQELVDKQLYVLTDKADRRLALRPEMTPSVARMIAANAGRLVFPARWYSHPNCHRYEKPQRGRVREHWQINVDIFGSESMEAEVEIFELIHAMFRSLGADTDIYRLRANDRVLAFSVLKTYAELDEEQLRPVLAILDRWEKIPRESSLEQFSELGLGDAQVEKLEKLCGFGFEEYYEAASETARQESHLAKLLKESLVDGPVEFSPLIVRGLDYYTSTVFEVFDVSAENKRSIFGGGRYDNLTSLFSKQRIPGIGFGMGDVTLFDFLNTHNLIPDPDTSPQVVVIPQNKDLMGEMRTIALKLREAGIRTITPLEPAGLGKEMKRANQRGAKLAVIVGAEEMGRGAVMLRDLDQSEQQEVPTGELAANILSALEKK